MAVQRRVIYGEDERVGQWIERHEGGFYRQGSKCIGLERNGRLVAGCLFDYYNGASVYVHVALADKRALGRDFLRACFGYVFNQLQCTVLIGLVAGDNEMAMRLDEHLGFHVEHTIEGAHPSGKLHVYTMRRHECRWLP
jgi:RimJ/RimL family protein N-acetyltransferase